MGGGKAFCSPVIRSYFFGEPLPLKYELYMYSSVSPPFPHLLGGTGLLEWVGVGYFPFFLWKARANLSLLDSHGQTL